MTKKSTTTFFVRHDSGLSLYHDGRQHAISSTHANFNKILGALKAKKYPLALKLIDTSAAINKHGVSERLPGQKIFVRNGRVLWSNPAGKEQELAGPLVDRILDDLAKPSFKKYGLALMRFLDNVQKNKVKDIRQELYEFLSSGKAPITMDGCFLAYKNVRNDFKDIHSGTFDNSPGRVVRIPQDEVDRNRNNTCSSGLHFATLGYLSSYSHHDNGHTVIVKVNPRHVFAIPTDYQFQKGRCSEYLVVGEWKRGANSDEAFKDSFVDERSKQKAMPDVEFVGKLAGGLEAEARGLGLIGTEGQITVWERTKGDYVPLVLTEKDEYRTLDGKLVEDEEIYEMSFTTKSVRAGVKKAIGQLKKRQR